MFSKRIASLYSLSISPYWGEGILAISTLIWFNSFWTELYCSVDFCISFCRSVRLLLSCYKITFCSSCSVTRAVRSLFFWLICICISSLSPRTEEDRFDEEKLIANQRNTHNENKIKRMFFLVFFIKNKVIKVTKCIYSTLYFLCCQIYEVYFSTNYPISSIAILSSLERKSRAIRSSSKVYSSS